MYATAHVVRRDTEEGLNVFLHVHGEDFAWPAEASSLPEVQPGRVVVRRVDLPPGGNRVRAYLDVLAPDGTPLSEIQSALRALARDLCERRNPTVFEAGRVTIRFGVESSLERLREEQLETLANSVLAVMRKGP